MTKSTPHQATEPLASLHVPGQPLRVFVLLPASTVRDGCYGCYATRLLKRIYMRESTEAHLCKLYLIKSGCRG
jgi:hypothetical protein